MAESTSRIVAIVDDDARVRVSLAALLQSAGFAVLTFSSGEDFFRSRDRQTIGCVIADIRMPGMTGLQLLAKIRHEHQDLPVVLVTGYRDDHMRERALRAGAAAFFYKPVNDLELLRVLESSPLWA